MACILCPIPPWFARIAKPLLKDWDLCFASLRERQIAREANRKAGWPDWLDEMGAAPVAAAIAGA